MEFYLCTDSWRSILSGRLSNNRLRGNLIMLLPHNVAVFRAEIFNFSNTILQLDYEKNIS